MVAYTHGARPWTVLAFLARTLLAVDETQNVPRAEKSEGFVLKAGTCLIPQKYWHSDFQGDQTAFWSSSRLSGGAYKFSLLSENATEKDCVYIVISNMYQGNSVRCLKD